MVLQLTTGPRTEADTIVSFLNFPSGGTLQKKLLLSVENKLGKVVWDIGEQNMRDTLEEKVLAALIDENCKEDFVKNESNHLAD